MTASSLGVDCEINVDKLIESRLLVQANSGAGKSWAIRRLLEQTYGKVQQILIDVDGEFHTLREKFDYVLAGQKGGDCPADIKSAALLAKRLLELNVSAIIDIYELGSQKKLFVKRFLDALVSAPRELWHPVLIVIDEAHIFAPEAGQAESASAVIDLMTLGRKRGFCGVLATQRISKLHKDAAAECNNKLIGRSALDIDMKRAASELGFTTREDTHSLRALKAGEFYAFGPAISNTVKLVKVGPVKTTHLKAGQRAAPPTPPRDRVKKVLAQLADLPHEAAEEAKTVDELRTQVKQLQSDLRKTKASSPTSTKVQIVEVALIKDAQIRQLEALHSKGDMLADKLRTALSALASSASALKEATKLAPGRERLTMGEPIKVGVQRVPERITVRPAPSNGVLPKGEAAILSALLQYPNGLQLHQLTVLTGYKATSRYEYLRSLKARGYVTEVGDRHVASPDGHAALPNVEPLPEGRELREWWLKRLSKGERIILEQLIAAYPEGVSNVDIEEATGYKATSRYEYLRQLAAKELVNDNRGSARACDVLFDGGMA